MTDAPYIRHVHHALTLYRTRRIVSATLSFIGAEGTLTPEEAAQALRSVISFGEWAAHWLVRDPSKRPSSLARDESVVRIHLLPALAKRQLAPIAPWDVQRLVNAWTKTSSPRTVRRQFDVLRAIFSAAVDDDRLLRSPCRNIKLPKVEQQNRQVISAEKLAELAAQIGSGLGADDPPGRRPRHALG